MKSLFKFSLAIIFSLPVVGYTNWEEDKICLQTLICNVNGALLKDNKDNRACIGAAVSAGVNLEKIDDQESDTPVIMCLSRETILSNPRIDYQANRIDIIPPVEEIPEYPQPPRINFNNNIEDIYIQNSQKNTNINKNIKNDPKNNINNVYIQNPQKNGYINKNIKNDPKNDIYIMPK